MRASAARQRSAPLDNGLDEIAAREGLRHTAKMENFGTRVILPQRSFPKAVIHLFSIDILYRRIDPALSFVRTI